MPWPVRCGRPGVLIAGSEAGVGDDFAGGGVHALAGGAWFRRGEGGILRAALEVPYFALTLGGFPEDGGAGDVALVALDAAAIVDQDHIAFAELLRLYAAVGEGGVLTEDGHGCAAGAEGAECGGDVGAEIALRHAFTEGGERGLVGFDGDIVGALQESDLGGRFDHAAARRYGGRADGFEGGGFLAKSVERGEADLLFEPQGSGDDAAIAQCLRGFGGFGGSPLGFAFERQNPRLAGLAFAGEIVHAGAALQVDGGHLVFAHEAAGLFDARGTLGAGDGLHAIEHGLELTDGLGKVALLRRGDTRDGACQEHSSIHSYQITLNGSWYR